MVVLERAEQLGALDAWLEDARRGHGRLVFVAGEAGVGKTTLVRAALDRARGRAVLAVSGCDGSATPPALAPLAELADQLPGLAWSEGAGRLELFAALLDVLRSGTPAPRSSSSRTSTGPTRRPWTSLRHLARRVARLPRAASS